MTFSLFLHVNRLILFKISSKCMKQNPATASTHSQVKKSSLFMDNLSSQVAIKAFGLECGHRIKNTVFIHMHMRTSDCWLSLGCGLLWGPSGRGEG